MFIMSCCCLLTEQLFSVYFLRQLYLFIYLLLIIKLRWSNYNYYSIKYYIYPVLKTIFQY